MSPVLMGSQLASMVAASPVMLGPMVNVPGGTFEMGSVVVENESPVHEATLSAFHLMSSPVTQRQYVDFANSLESWKHVVISDQVGKTGVYALATSHEEAHSVAERICREEEIGEGSLRTVTIEPFDDGAFNFADGPMTGKNWFEALAFASLQGGKLNAGTLPTEWQLVCAAKLFLGSEDFHLKEVSGEWALNRHGPYPEGAVEDPIGPTTASPEFARSIMRLHRDSLRCRSQGRFPRPMVLWRDLAASHKSFSDVGFRVAWASRLAPRHAE